MSIVFPIDAPVDFGGLAAVEIRPRNRTGTAYSPFTFKQQTFRYPDQRWMLSVNVQAMRRPQGERWAVFLTALDGVRGTFLMGDPLARRPQGAADTMTFASGFPRISAAADVGADEIEVEGFTPSTPRVFQAGDYVQLGTGNTTTLHMILSDTASNGSGEVTLPIWPALRRPAILSEPLTYINPRGRFRLSSNERNFDQDASGRYTVAFDAMEAIP
jgi:hypothetical protein